MQRFRIPALWATLLVPAALYAQTVTTSGTVSVAVGGALQEGDRAAFQEAVQQAKRGFGGIENFQLTREADDSLFKFDARILPGNEDYRLHFRFEKTDRFYVDAGYEQFRVWYDGSGGFFHPTAMSFRVFDEELHLDRGRLWAEAGLYTANQTLFRFRVEHRTREGTKDSTLWGDANAPAPYGTRNIVPTLMDLDESTTTISLDVGNETQEAQKWNVGARYSETEMDDRRYSRRQPFSPTADRIVTTRDETKNDIFAAHGFYLRQITEKLTLSGGALISELDTHIAGSRIYGQAYDPVYDPAYLRRQARDEGFYDLEGDADLKQTILNLNAVYNPTKHWSFRPSIRFENLSQQTMTDFVETNIGTTANRPAILEPLEAEHDKDWSEFSETIEARYTGVANWTFNLEGNWVQGTGDLTEHLGEHGVLSIDRDTELERITQKYSASANWYAKPGLTFAAQYYFKVNVNDYDAVRDNTSPGTADRYPAFITDQDFETHDVNLRMSWRPLSQLNLVSRYDHQESTITSIEAGLPKVQSSEFSSDILSQNVTWSPTARLYLNASINVTFDQLKTPAYPIVLHGDNNYVNGSVGGGYALAQKDDLYFDYSWFNASNFIDNSARGLPYGLSQKQQTAYLTWVRRHTEQLVYTVKYGYVTNDDTTFGGMNDFDAHVLYAKVQYHF